ncbi:condensation domain-containing protein [Lolliginicoccus suaedae]|uniref:condensation domain-containing protein n=1 Tax=Lolliginicoccus suaedae TaxID=2605429 RepID=UPI001659B8C8|nr:condensation domain-containing protein [Lolliginicoccus suaedae]
MSKASQRDQAAMETGRIPLTASQANAWFAQRMNPGIPDCLARYVTIDGPLDAGILRRAIDQTAAECGLTTTRITEHDGWPYQQITSAPRGAGLAIVDLSGEDDPAGAAQDWMCLQRSTPVDMLHGPLLEAALLVLGPSQHIWYTRVHRIIADPASCQLFLRRVAQVHNAMLADRSAPPFRGLPITDLVEQDHAYRGSAAYDGDHDYWSTTLDGATEATSLAGTTAPASVATVRESAAIPASTASMLDEVAQYSSSTATAIITAAFAGYLSRITGTSDTTLTFPVPARTRIAIRRSASALGNTVPLRTGINEDTTISEAIRAARDRIAGAIAHQRFRNDDIIREHGLIGDHAHAFGPTINLALADPTILIEGTTAVSQSLTDGLVHDLVVTIRYDQHSALVLDIEANPKLYTHEEIAAHLQRFLNFLGKFGDSDPRTPLRSVAGIQPLLQLV